MRATASPPLLAGMFLPLLVTIAGGAQASGIACKAAPSPTGQAICGSPELSRLDDQMARDYDGALHALSPAGAAQLKESQRGWWRWLARACVQRTPPQSPGRSLEGCLAGEFRERLRQLDQAVVRVGPYTFSRIDAFTGHPVKGDLTGHHPGFATTHRAVLQIDRPTTPATATWNAEQFRTSLAGPPDADKDGNIDIDIDPRVACAGERFVSLSIITSEYEHGAAHGTWSYQASNAILQPAWRKMTPTDVFKTGSGWQATLPDLFWKAYLDTSGDDVIATPETEQAIRQAAQDPAGWLLTPDGMRLEFGA